MWLFLSIGGPFRGCPYEKSPAIWGLHEVPLTLETPIRAAALEFLEARRAGTLTTQSYHNHLQSSHEPYVGPSYPTVPKLYPDKIWTHTSSPQLPLKRPQTPSNSNHKALKRGALGAGILESRYEPWYSIGNPHVYTHITPQEAIISLTKPQQQAWLRKARLRPPATNE